MRKLWIFGSLAVLAIGAAVLFVMERPLSVTVVRPETDVALRIYGLGTVEARVLSRIGFEVGAALSTLSADAGDSVAKGQELATLHPAEQEARVARARAAVAANAANLAKAEAAVDRARAATGAARNRQQAAAEPGAARRGLRAARRRGPARRGRGPRRPGGGRGRCDLIRAQTEDAAAALQLEETLLAHHRLTAPFDAVIVARHAEPGAVVQSGDPIFTLIDPGHGLDPGLYRRRTRGPACAWPAGHDPPALAAAGEFNGTIARIGLESDRVNEERRVWLTCADCPEPCFWANRPRCGSPRARGNPRSWCPKWRSPASTAIAAGSGWCRTGGSPGRTDLRRA